MGVAIFFLVIAVLVLFPIALVNGIRYRRLKYMCLCDGIDRRFRIDKDGEFVVRINKKDYDPGDAYKYLRQPALAEQRLESLLDDDDSYRPGSWKLQEGTDDK